MPKVVHFTIDDREYLADEGQYIIEAAHSNGVYIPTLCNIKGLKPRGACRICSVKVNGRLMAACTTPVTNGMKIENDSSELNDVRRAILETLFVEGNHMCPSCEKSGFCKLQALAYRYRIMVPRFPYQFPRRRVEADNTKLIKDHNRCILCKRCIRAIKTDDGKSIFAFRRRSHRVEIGIDPQLGAALTDEKAQQAMDLCPVGALLKKEKGFDVPIGRRKYDHEPIGIESDDSVPSAPH